MSLRLPPFLWLLGLLTQVSVADAANFSYFDSEIDYWHDKSNAVSAPKGEPVKPESALASADSKFDWKKHLDPSNREFFREGDYVPPEPFMELVRNPTDENIKNWLAMIEKKNELSERMTARIQEYLAKNAATLAPQARSVLVDTKESIQKAAPEASRYRFRFYFDSKCPHCKRMFETVSDLQSRGFYVEALQIDDADVAFPGLTAAVIKASRQDVEKHQIKSVPYLLIGDLQKKVVYRLAGYQSTDSVFVAINAEGKNK